MPIYSVGILAGRDDSVVTLTRDGIMTLAGVVGAVGNHRADLVAERDLAEQIGRGQVHHRFGSQ